MFIAIVRKCAVLIQFIVVKKVSFPIYLHTIPRNILFIWITRDVVKLPIRII